MNMINIDPRTKIVVIVCLSTLAVFLNTPGLLLLLFAFTLVVLSLLRVNFLGITAKFKKLIPLLLAMLFIQSAFAPGGEVLLSLGGVPVLTAHGINSALCILFRMLTFFASAMIIMTSNSKDYILALVQLKIPYEIAFMVMVAFRFACFVEEVKDTLVAIQLRVLTCRKLPGETSSNFIAIFSHPCSTAL